MKICIAQIQAITGHVSKNINNHIHVIEKAISHACDLIVFPELSLTNYEPRLASNLATDIMDSRFDVFQNLSDKNVITIAPGMTIQTEKGIHISLLFFSPNTERSCYAKQLLHADEHPYFICGNQQKYLNIKGHKIAFGICYESLQPEHFTNAYKNGADIYIASVAKSQKGIDKAFTYYAKTAKAFHTSIIMANCIGVCDDFEAAGQSAVWNEKGKQIGLLNNSDQGILVFDTVLKNTQVKI